MSVYLVCNVRVDDPETYRKYTARTPDIIRQYGGRFVVRGGDIEVIEGPAFSNRLVILEFPDRETARRFYNSPEYQEVIGYRQAASEASFLLADGVPEGVAAPDAQVVRS